MPYSRLTLPASPRPRMRSTRSGSVSPMSMVGRANAATASAKRCAMPTANEDPRSAPTPVPATRSHR